MSPIDLAARRELDRIKSKTDEAESFAKAAIASVNEVALEVNRLSSIVERNAEAIAGLAGGQKRILESLSGLRGKFDDVITASAERERVNSERDRALALAADRADTKASGARRLFDGLHARQSHLEAEFQARVGIALAEGNAQAEAREARQRIVATLTSGPVALAIVAAIGGAGLWAVLGLLVALTFAFVYLARTRKP